MNKTFHVYLMASKRNGTLYTGVTSDLLQRVHQHKEGMAEGFTKKYNINYLVYFETYGDIRDAIAREKQIKGWSRKKKNDLIITLNPKWNDLYETLLI